MCGRLILQSAAILWLVQAAYTRGYGAASGLSNGQGPQHNGNHPPNGDVGRLLIPSKGVGAQYGYGGHPTKGIDYGPAVGVSSANGAKSNAAGLTTRGSTKGNGAVTGLTNGDKPHGYGGQAGPVGGQQVKGNGYGAHAGGYGGRGAKGIGHRAAAGAVGVNGVNQNGNGAASLAHYGFGTKGNGQGAVAGSSNNNGARLGQGNAENKPMKGYGRPPYGSVQGPGAGMGAFRGLGGPQFARNQGKAYSSNGHNGYSAQPVGGYNGGYGSAGLALGSPYGHGGLKGPKQGYGGAAARPNREGAKPQGYGYPSGGATKPAKPGYGNIQNRIGAKQNVAGYGATRGGAVRPQTGYGNRAGPSGYGKPSGYGTGAGVPNPYAAKASGYGVRSGAALGGYGSKLNGYGAGSKPQATKGLGAASPGQDAKTLSTSYSGAAGVPNGQLAKAANSGYSMLPNGKAAQAAGASADQSLRVLSPEQLNPAPQGFVPQAALAQGVTPAVPEPTSGILVMVTPEQYQHLLSPVAQGKSYKQPQMSSALLPVLLQGKGHKPALQAVPEPALMIPQWKAPKAATSGPAAAVPQGNLAAEPAVILPEENRGASITKGQGAKPTNPDCDSSGVPNGQWMKIPRPGYHAGAKASAGTTKGYGAGAYPNGGGAKANKPTYGGGFAVPGLIPGLGNGVGYLHTAKPKQPGYGQEAYLGAGYGNGNSHKGYGSGYRAGVQPDYASLGQSAPTADGKSGGAKQIPYSGGPVVPAGLDRISQVEPQSPGVGLNGKLGSVYGGFGSLPFGGQTLGTERPNAKYGLGGLQFAGQPFSTANNGAGNYGGLSAGIGEVPLPGKHGYGRMAYQAQPVSLGPDMKAIGKYGLPGSPYQPEHLGRGHSGKLGKYGAGDPASAPQGLVGEAKSSGKYDTQGVYQLQPLGSASDGRSGGQYDTAGLPYQPLPMEPESAGKHYVKGEVPTPASVAEGEGMAVNRYDNVGYINGQVQPEVVAFPAAPTLSPTLAYPSVPSYLTGESHLTPDAVHGAEVLPDPAAAASLDLESAPATETRGSSLGAKQLPRQIHIQQQLKLHFHPQNKSWRGANNGNHDLKGFFGNSG